MGLPFPPVSAFGGLESLAAAAGPWESSAAGLALGAGLWLSALNVQFRDVGRLVPVLLQIGLYASPIFYPVSLVPANWRWLYDLNPVVGLVEAMRWAVFSFERFPLGAFSWTCLAAVLLIVTGAFVFRHMEENAADVV